MKTVISLVRIFLYYTLFFVLGRLMFFLMNLQTGGGVQSLFSASLHGLPMDLSTAGYLSLINGAILFIGNLLVWNGSKSLIHFLNKTLTAVMGVFIIIDARLYSYWGYHIDASILDYLNTPKEAMASANGFDWIVVVLLSLVLILVAIRGYQWFVGKWYASYKLKRANSIVAVVVMGVLILPVRGGFDVATMNVSTVYFSTDPFENHLALNSVWNGAFSLVENKQDSYCYMDEAKSKKLHKELYSEKVAITNGQFKDSANVIVIVLESFTANVVSTIGGIEGITPNLNKWMGQGLSFENCYSSGDRSDKGLTTLYTGFPSLPNARLLSYPNKLGKVPKVYEGFKNKGYKTSFYYGGNLNFANIKLLFSDGSVNRIVSGEDVATVSEGKWGVRDADMFDRFYSDITAETEPFFATLYTLSSHEPFDIPAVSFTSDSLTSDFYKAIYYTDSCFGVFMDKLSQSKVWNNTVVVVTADHGVKNPGNLVHLSPRKFRVPLLFTGGAVTNNKRYTHYCSHTDIPYTLESAVTKAIVKPYQFSKSVFDTTSSFAFYYYVLGTGMINENGCVVYDIGGDVFLVNTTNNDSIYSVMRQQILGVTQKASSLFNSY